MSEAEQIAAKLTAAQRRALSSLSEHPTSMSITWCARFGYGLERLGLAKRTVLTDRSFLTPLGVDVRQILLSGDQ